MSSCVLYYSCCILIFIFQEQLLIPFSSCGREKYLNNFRGEIFTLWELTLCVEDALQRQAPNQCTTRICKVSLTLPTTVIMVFRGTRSYFCSTVWKPPVE